MVADPEGIASIIPYYAHLAERMAAIAESFTVAELEAIARYLRAMSD